MTHSVGTYFVLVQYGSGMQFIMGQGLTLADATSQARFQLKHRMAKWKRGAKPSAMVCKVVEVAP